MRRSGGAGAERAEPDVKAPAGALVSSSNLLQPGPGQELGVPSQKRAGTPGHQRGETRVIWTKLCSMTGQAMAPGSRRWVFLLSCHCTRDSRVAPLKTALTMSSEFCCCCPSQKILNKVQLRLGHQGLIPLQEREEPKLLSESKRKVM